MKEEGTVEQAHSGASGQPSGRVASRPHIREENALLPAVLVPWLPLVYCFGLDKDLSAFVLRGLASPAEPLGCQCNAEGQPLVVEKRKGAARRSAVWQYQNCWLQVACCICTFFLELSLADQCKDCVGQDLFQAIPGAYPGAGEGPV